MRKYFFFERQADGNNPGGVTVSRTGKLPVGDFRITEYSWPDKTTIWFIDAHRFTADEREECYHAMLTNPKFETDI